MIRQRDESPDPAVLFAKHESCLASTDEGFENAAASFPTPCVSDGCARDESPGFAEALRALW
jgi:hypothetical protein